MPTALGSINSTTTLYTATEDVAVSDGGTGVSSFTAYAVLCGGTTGTNPVQSIAGVGTVGQILTSNGAGVLPTFQAAPAGFTAATGAEIDTGTDNTKGATPLAIADSTKLTNAVVSARLYLNFNYV